ncbi:MAG: methyltransferase domain-containing protein [Clostridiales bacterium]|nr:methyltransferase domain-containing protein [Clostridiales bacterium]
MRNSQLLTAENLSSLVAAAKQKRGREEINQNLGDRAALYEMMSHESGKVRKNAYRLCGALEQARDIPALCEALEREITLFAVPSLLLALGALGAEEPLAAYVLPTVQSPAQEKNVREIRETLEKVRKRFDKTPLKNWDKLDRPQSVLCAAPEGFAEELAQELTELGFAPQADGTVQTDDLAGLYRANGLVEALLPIAKDIPLDAIADAMENEESGVRHGECTYRVSLLGYEEKKAPLIAEIVRALGGKNNPSHYDCEVRVMVKQMPHSSPLTPHCDVFLKPCNVTDNRYPWRRQTIAASLNPATAACLCRWAKGLERVETPRVLDPFCGSGALLFSREALGPCACLIGVDKSAQATQIARENAKVGGSRAVFVTKDSLRFAAKEEGFDLILSNLPFGNRVGSHADNETLYRGFVRRLPALLAENGLAVLYTMEYRLLAKCLRSEPKLRLVAQKRTEAGGLLPWVLAIARKL